MEHPDFSGEWILNRPASALSAGAAGEIVNTHEGVTMASSLRWDGDDLVVRWRIGRPDGEMTIAFRYELTADRLRLTAREELRGTDHDQDNVWVFDRSR